ncbi:MAG: TonB-dependent receptor [Opitutaceae bacterium]|nr:TonB-dependent receptor [Opitutaceae bacterium]
MNAQTDPLVWTGAQSDNWDTTASNWTLSGAAAVYSDGSHVRFDDTSATGTVSIPAAVAPGSTTIDITRELTLAPGSAAGLAGPGNIIKRGSGTLIFSAANATPTGTTTLEEGVLRMFIPGSYGTPSLGSMIVLSGGTLTTNNYGATATLSTPIHVPAGADAVFAVPRSNEHYQFHGVLTGSGTLTLIGASRRDVYNDYNGFSGEMRIVNGSVRIMQDVTTTWANATLLLDAVTVTFNVNNRNLTIGALSGTSSASRIQGRTGGTGTYTIGAKNLDTIYGGSIEDNGTGIVAITKVGAGMMTLTGSLTHTGLTTVSAGGLNVTGTFHAASAVSVSAGASFGGSGVISGNAAYTSGATLLTAATASGMLAGIEIGGAVSLGAAHNVSAVVPDGVQLTPGSHTITVLHAAGGITGTPALTWTGPAMDAAVTFNQTSDTITATIVVPLPPAPVITSELTASGTVGEAFSHTITASNLPTSFAATGLPSGLSIDTTTGVISGTPVTDATSTVTITAANLGGTSAPASLVITIEPMPLPESVPAITSALTATGTLGAAFEYQITAAPGPILGYDATPLPAGLSIDGSTGAITGSIAVTGTSAITLSATNAIDAGTATLVLSAYEAPAITSALAADGIVDQPFSYTLTASGGPNTLSVSGLPDGLSFDAATGVISGTPTIAAESNITLTASNPAGTDTQTLVLTVATYYPDITSALNVVATVGQPFSYQITALNNPTGFAAEPLPAGFSFNTATGVITGTPVAAGVLGEVLLTASNAYGSRDALLTIIANDIPPSDVLVWTGAISNEWDTTTANWKRNGSPATYSDGAKLYFDDTSASVSGTIVMTGTHTPESMIIKNAERTLTLVSSATSTLSGTAPMTMQSTGTLVFSSTMEGWNGITTLESGVVDRYNSYTGAVVFAGGTMTITYPAGSQTYGLAHGLYVGEGQSGVINMPNRWRLQNVLLGSGTLTLNYDTTVGRADFQDFDPVDFSGALILSGSGGTRLPAGNASTFNWSTGFLNTTLVLERYLQLQPATNSGGNTFYIGAIAGSSPDVWLRGGSAGAITYRVGAKNLDTTYAGVIGDYNETTASRALNAALYKEGTGMLTLTGSLNYTGATTVYSGGLLMNGRHDAEGGGISVTGSTAAGFGGSGVIAPNVIFQDGAQLLVHADPGSGELSGMLVTGSVTFDGSVLKVRPVVAEGGTITNGVYTIFMSDFDFTGRPALEWSHPADTAIQGALDYINENQIQVTITGGAIPPPTITSAPIADALAGQPFTYMLTASGDTTVPTQLSVEDIPAGLSFNAATGVISGTVATSGQYTVTLIAGNVSGERVETLTLHVYDSPPAAPVIANPSQAIATVGRSMTYQILTTGGIATGYGATGLPSGLSFNAATGVISGAPERLGVYAITITASNLGGADSKTIELIVALPPPVPQTISNTTAVQNELYVGETTWTNEPAGYEIVSAIEYIGGTVGGSATYLNVDSNGAISGICPNVATSGTVPLTIQLRLRAWNLTGATLAQTTLTVNPQAPVVTDSDQLTATVGVPLSHTIVATNMYPAYMRTYGVTNIPSGLNVNPKTGEIYGAPLLGGVFEVALVASNVTGAHSKLITLTINGASALTTLAGEAGTSGDTDGASADARFNSPGAGAVGPDGSIYVADTANNAIRKIAPDGTVTTLVTGINQPAGLAVCDDGSTLYAIDAGSGAIKKIDAATGVTTTLILTGSPALNAPGGLAPDASGNLYVADTGNHLIRKIDTGSGAMTTIAGAGAAGSTDGTGAAAAFDGPTGLALSADETTLCIADTGNNTIRALDTATGAVTTLAGAAGVPGSTDGIASALFNSPTGLALDSSGVLYVADTGGHIIRAVNTNTGAVTTFAGTADEPGSAEGNVAGSRLDSPRGITIDPATGDIHVFDTGNHTVRTLQIGPTIITPPADQSVPLNSTATFAVVASGAPSLTYQWYRDGVLIDGATEATLRLESVTLTDDVADYSVVVANPIGICTVSAHLSISDASPSTPSDVGAGDGHGSVSGGGAPGAWYLAALALLVLARFRGRMRRLLFSIFDSRFSIARYRAESKSEWSGSSQSFRGRRPTVCQIENLKSKIFLPVFSAILLLAAATPDLAAQAAANGTIIGRVVNQATGQYLSNALVAIEGTSIETLTDETGTYRLVNVPAGAVRITASYSGLDKNTQTVSVSPNRSASADFNLTTQVYQLEKFVVAGDREGSARIIQEQRMSATQKAIFAADSFGNIIDSNFGELMKNLPGVTLDYDGEDASTMRIRGMDPDLANITLDGNEVASTGVEGTDVHGNTSESRAFNLKTVALQNIESITIDIAPTPDKPASSMGGSVDITTKSALRQRGRRVSFSTNLSLNTAELDFDKTPGGGRTPNRKIQPGFDFSWIETFGTRRRFGISFNTSFNRNYRYNNEYGSANPRKNTPYTYNTEDLALTDNKVTATTSGYVSQLRWKENAGSNENRMISLNLDFEPWGRNHSFFLRSSYNDVRGLGSYSRYLQVDAGTRGEGSDLYTMISPSGAKVSMGNSVSAANNRNYSFNFGGKHRFGELKAEYSISYSRAEVDPDPDENYSINYSASGLGINIFNLAGNSSGKIVQTSHNGGGVVSAGNIASYQNLDNYNSLTLTNDFKYTTTENRGAYLDLTYPVIIPFFGTHSIPVDIKFGGRYGESKLETNRYYRVHKMTGGSTIPSFGTPSEPLLREFSDKYFENSWGFDVPIATWVSPYRVYDYYKAHPEAFYDGSDLPDSQVYNELRQTKYNKESTTAAYLMLTARLLGNLTMTTGVRYEEARRKGWGPVYERYDSSFFAATGKFDTVSPLIEAPDFHPITNPAYIDNPLYGISDVEKTRLLFTRQYYNQGMGDYFPNIQFKWTPHKDFNIRLSRTENIGRPPFGQMLADDEWRKNYYTITRGNPELKPQTSNKYDAAFEWYPTSGGMLTLSLFYQKMKNIIYDDMTFITVTNDASEATVYAVPEGASAADIIYHEDEDYAGLWAITTPRNIGEGSNKGFELAYRQKLGFIHPSLNSLELYAVFSYADPQKQYQRHIIPKPSSNVTQEMMDEYNNSIKVWESIPLEGIQKRSASLQFRYNGKRWSGKLASYWADEFARRIRTDIVEITNQNSTFRLDLNLSYKISSRWTASFDWRNITNQDDERKVFDRTGGYFTSGMVINLGVRANF